MTEGEFWQTHTVLTNEVEATEESYFVQKEVNEFVGSHPKALRRMQRNPLFGLSRDMRCKRASSLLWAGSLIVIRGRIPFTGS